MNSNNVDDKLKPLAHFALNLSPPSLLHTL